MFVCLSVCMSVCLSTILLVHDSGRAFCSIFLKFGNLSKVTIGHTRPSSMANKPEVVHIHARPAGLAHLGLCEKLFLFIVFRNFHYVQ